MGYRLHPGEGEGEERTNDAATLSAAGEGEVDYLAVVTFVFMLLDSGVSASQLSDALDQVATLNPKKDHTIMANCCGRARLAAGLVNAFLMKDSYERGLEKG